MSQDFFYGYALNAVDGKSRLSIPADYRQVIQTRSGSKELRLATSRNAPCLLGYDTTHFSRLMADHEARFANQVSRGRDKDATATFGPVSPLTIDDAGRIVLPPVLKRLGKIASHVWFIAGGNYFECWNPWVYLADPDADATVAEILRFELEAKGLPLQEPIA